MIDKSLFVRFPNWTAGAAGRPQTFVLACAIIVGWALTGPLFDYSDTWQLVINTGTTVITFLVVFLIQNAQNRDSKAVHLKLDELLPGFQGPRTSMVDLESLTDDELDKLRAEFQRLRQRLQGGAGEQELQ